MDKKSGYTIFGGMLLGALLGTMWAVNGNLLLGLAGGAVGGTFIGWFIAAAVMEKAKKEKK